MRAARARLPDSLRWLPRQLGYRQLPMLASTLRKWWVLLRHPHATIEFGRHVYLGPGFTLNVPHPATVSIGDGVEFRRGFTAELGPDARLVIGAGTRFTYDAVVQCGTSIEIGRRCLFAHAVTVVDGSHRFRDLSVPTLEQGYDFRPIVIEDDVSVMAKTTVIASIRERAFIGANSVVTREVPAYVVAVGVPARPIDYFGPEGGEPAGLEPPSSAS